MSGSANIKGVTSGFSRHLGGGVLDSKKRFLDSKGYTKAFKKTFKTSDLNKIKERFKEAGLKTNRFSTLQKIKEKDFLDDLKRVARAGIIRNQEIAESQFKQEQIKENRDLTFKEKRSFNILSKKTKQRLIWGNKKRDLSLGARIAAEQQKIRDENIRKVGDVGIAGFETLEKQGDPTLWRRYKILKDAPYRNEAARKKLKEISIEMDLIRLKAKKDPKVLRIYGMPEIQKSKSVWRSKEYLGLEGVKAKENPKYETGISESGAGQETQKDESSSSQTSVNIAHSGSSAPAGVEETSTRKAPVLPFSIVKGSKNFIKEVSTSPDKTGAKSLVSKENINREESEQDKQYGFIDQTEGDVKLDSSSQKMGVDEKCKNSLD